MFISPHLAALGLALKMLFFLSSLPWIRKACELNLERICFLKSYQLYINWTFQKKNHSLVGCFLTHDRKEDLKRWMFCLKPEVTECAALVIRYGHQSLREYFVRNQWKLPEHSVAPSLHHVWMKRKIKKEAAWWICS